MKITLFCLGSAIAVGVFAVMIHSIATFRLLPDGQPAAFERRTGTEILWAIIPILIVIVMALPALRALAH